MTTPVAAPAPGAASCRWIFNPAVDLLVGCGAWSLPLLALTFYLGQRDAVHMSFAFYFLGVFCNQPHYMATVYRAYHTQEDFRKYRFFTVYITVFIVLTVLLVHLAPAAFPWVLTFYLTWSPWHYTGQNYGIAMMMARRAGARPSDEERQLIWWSYFASYVAWFLALHNTTTEDPSLVILPIPATIALHGKVWFFLVFLVAGGFGHYRLVQQVGWRAMTAPLALFATQFLWFPLPDLLKEFTELEFPPSYSSAGVLAFMHCAQYLWITSYYARREAEAAGPDGTPRPADAPATFRWSPYYLLLVVGGIALFLPGPWLASRVFGHDLVQSFFMFSALVNLHHFLLDGAIWKLRDGRIARLLLGRNPPADEHHEAEHAATRPWLGWLFGPAAGARALRYSLAILLLALAAVDQTQFWLTLKDSSPPALALARQINPQDTRTHFHRAKALANAGQVAEAIAELRQSVAINPGHMATQHLLGELLFRTGDNAAARVQYEEMLRRFPPDVVTLANSGILASRAGDMAQAVERFEAAIKLAPENMDVRLYLGETLEKAGRLPEAIRQYEIYAKWHEDNVVTPEVLGNFLLVGLKLGALYHHQGQAEVATAWCRRVIQLAREYNRPTEAAAAEARLRALGLDPNSPSTP
jgi:tetratricopeptide (TPR) repeat protein